MPRLSRAVRNPEVPDGAPAFAMVSSQSLAWAASDWLSPPTTCFAERPSSSGRNQVDLFLMADQGETAALERLRTPRVSTYQEDQEHGYETRHSGGGGIVALVRRPGDDPGLEREGILVFAVGHQGVVTRLRFSYNELERGRGGREIMPVSDGRRLLVQPAGSGLDGAVDLVIAVGDGTQVHGWAADLERGERPRQIVVYRDSKF